jgi:glycosyltransferase involved in cell wall biosynthesis
VPRNVQVAFCVPSLNGPTAPFVTALEQSLPLITGAGWGDICVEERGNPYISVARATMLRKALDAGADVIVFIDYDLSWDAGDLLKLIETPGDVVAGTYRYKKDEVEYMGALFCRPDNRPVVRADGCIKAQRIPAGFLKITKEGVDRFMKAYPDLCFGPRYNLSVDIFNHGAHEGIWFGEDYAFSRNWIGAGGDIWIVPDLNLTHHGDKPYPGNFHEFMLRQPGGLKEAA